MLTAVNLEELLIAYRNSEHPVEFDKIKSVVVTTIVNDDIWYTVHYEKQCYYDEQFTMGYTDLILWYINKRTGV